MRLWYLRSRIGVGLEALAEIIPKFTEKDLVVAQRKNDKGVWRSELWSSRDFEANELLLAPLSSQLKETHLMAAAHAVVGVPKHGRGAHPENQSLALYGRARTLVAMKGSIDDEDHHGSLYWLVGRTSRAAECNLILEQVSWEQKITMTLPNSKRRKQTSERSSSELPDIPILVNKKAISKHTKLLVFQAEKKKACEIKEG